jgi:TRAP-type C4-dicarboxylate transport system substrate-binding protein
MFATEPAYIQSKSRVATLADLRGLELRVAGGGVSTLKALGVTPVGMPMSEVAEALQTGVIEGNASSREVLYDFKFAETLKYVVDYPLHHVAFAALMDIDKWNTLPADVQDVINELGREMALWAGEYLDNHVKKSMEWAVQEQGVEIVTLSAEEKAKWDAALQPLIDATVEKQEKEGLPARAFMNRLFELRDKYSKEFS